MPMEKISITVRVPALDNTFEFMVPDNMPAKDLLNLIVRILNSEFGVPEDTSDLMLFDTLDSSTLRLEYSLDQMGISDGAQLILL